MTVCLYTCYLIVYHGTSILAFLSFRSFYSFFFFCTIVHPLASSTHHACLLPFWMCHCHQSIGRGFDEFFDMCNLYLGKTRPEEPQPWLLFHLVSWSFLHSCVQNMSFSWWRTLFSIFLYFASEASHQALKRKSLPYFFFYYYYSQVLNAEPQD